MIDPSLPFRLVLWSWMEPSHCPTSWYFCYHLQNIDASSAVIPGSAVQTAEPDWFRCSQSCQSFALLQIGLMEQILTACSSHDVKMRHNCYCLSLTWTDQDLSCWYSKICSENELNSWISSWEMTFSSSSCMVNSFCHSRICYLNRILQRSFGVGSGSQSCHSVHLSWLHRS